MQRTPSPISLPRPATFRRAYPAWTHLGTGVVLTPAVAVPRVRDALVLHPVFIRSAPSSDSHATSGR